MRWGRRAARSTRPRRALLALGVGLLLGAAPLVGQQPQGAPAPAQEEADRAISELRSPYCPGLMLEVCPSPQAAELRDSIRALAAEEGMSSDELVEWMIARHGEEWRGVPKRQGRGIWAWVVPPLVLLGGAGLVAVRLRRGSAGAELAPAPPEVSEADRARISEALREMERAEELDD